MVGNVAIDGPAGAGKSTVSKLLADKLGYLYVDTGAMYRALTWKVMNQKIAIDDESEIARMAELTDIDLKYDARRALQVFCDGQEVTSEIRQQAVSKNVSRVARIAAVRHHMVNLQRRMADKQPVVMDGRDIGSYVLPHAQHKFFLTASIEERARRRCQQLDEQNIPFVGEEVKKEIEDRDEMDRSREIAPLIKAPDAILLDTSCQTVEEVIDEVLKVIRGE